MRALAVYSASRPQSRGPVNERIIHRVFEASILLKALHALIECAGGIALYVVSSDTIVSLVRAMTQSELVEDPNDYVATHLLAMAQGMSISSKSFYAFYLLSHGLVATAPFQLGALKISQLHRQAIAREIVLLDPRIGRIIAEYRNPVVL